MAAGILMNATIAGEAGTLLLIADGNMDFVVASFFDTYATQFASQTNVGAFLDLSS
jgi:hypothetical protein